MLAALESSRQDAERARDDAERANRLKDEFLATLSHELRTPLNAILGWVSLLRDRRVESARIPKVLGDRGPQRAIAGAARSPTCSTCRASSPAGSGSACSRSVISRILRDAMDTVRPAADAKEITLDLTRAGRAAADERRRRAAAPGLLEPALERGEVHAGRRPRAWRRIDRVDSQIRVTISDSGVGIPREFLPYAFERFRQADQSFTRPHGGLGLGLAIVKHLVETHGGEVSVASEGPGTGTTFTVQLPIGGAQALAVAEPESDVAANEDGGPEIGTALFGQAVLVVDDDATTRDLLATLLTERGARVATADSAAAAIESLETEVPSVIIADVGMPGQDGLSMMRVIRRRPPHMGGAVPSIALSAFARAEDRRAALSAGFDEYLTKPALPADVLGAVARVLASAPQPHAVKSTGGHG